MVTPADIQENQEKPIEQKQEFIVDLNKSGLENYTVDSYSPRKKR